MDRPDPIPCFLGIVNLTPDSFSDGGLYLEPEKAIEHGKSLVSEGAHVLDLGAQSSNPDSVKINVDQEIGRLEPVVRYFLQQGIPISVDTYEPEVQVFAMNLGVDFINDIHGFSRTEIYPEIARSRAKLIVMHSIQRTGHATRVDSDPEVVYRSMEDFFSERIDALETAGVDRNRIILDPGMGFFLGANPDASYSILSRTAELKSRFGLPVLISVSRKSFLGNLTDRPVADRGAATLSAELFALEAGADYIRTHDPGATRDGWMVRNKLKSF